MKKYIVILQTGQSIKRVCEKYGDFDTLFIKAMGINKELTKTIHVYKSLDFPNPKEIAGILITGSPAMVTQKNEWCIQTQNWLKQFINTSIPLLGICYGHQLLANLLGGKVQWNPNGREIGQVEMAITAAARKDPLLNRLITDKNTLIKLQATHQQSVTYLPENITLLGTTKLDPYHSFCYQQHIWGMQFHPEFTPDIIKDYIRLRYDDIVEEGLNPDQLIDQVQEIDNGKVILQQFHTLCFSAYSR